MAVGPQLVDPVCSVRPARGGTVAFAPLRTGPIPGLPYGTVTAGEFKSFRYTATPAPGWRFARFETSVTWTSETASTVGGSWFAGASAGGSWIYDAEPGDTYEDYFGKSGSAGFASWDKIEAFGFVEYQAATAISVVAVFERVPTHLLVNSSAAENPAKLVHDPATGLLVGDYW